MNSPGFEGYDNRTRVMFTSEGWLLIAHPDYPTKRVHVDDMEDASLRDTLEDGYHGGMTAEGMPTAEQMRAARNVLNRIDEKSYINRQMGWQN